MPARQTLVVVSGPPGTGETTLARSLALELGCPAIIRDEIKQGRCVTPTLTIIERMTERARSDRHRAAHGDRQLRTDIAAGAYSPEGFVDISLDVPTLLVDTSDGYQSGTAEIAAFVRAR